MKKIILIVVLTGLIAGAVGAWIFLGPGTGFSDKSGVLYIRSDAATKEAVMDSIARNEIVSNEKAFEMLAGQMDYWKSVKPGKYVIKKGTSLLSIVRMLRNGKQTPVDLTITKLRTKEDFSRLAGRKFEFDSSRMMEFFNDPDSMKKFGVLPETALWNVLPDTYTYYWTATPSQVYKKLKEESEKFWTDERKGKSASLGLTPLEVYILASIIEEETTNHSEKDTIASVYLNRLKIGMPLQADPTLKFAAKNFALKRIAGEILKIESPYNTYVNKGLPPGPIATPSRTTIDKVLNPASTSYLYFVAKPKLGGHLFSSTYQEHLRKRADYLAADKIRLEKEKKSTR